MSSLAIANDSPLEHQFGPQLVFAEQGLHCCPGEHYDCMSASISVALESSGFLFWLLFAFEDVRSDRASRFRIKTRLF